MGKLHSIRRAIKRDPEKFFYKGGDGVLYANSIQKRTVFKTVSDNKWQARATGEWIVTSSWVNRNICWRCYVAKILNELGYDVKIIKWSHRVKLW